MRKNPAPKASLYLDKNNIFHIVGPSIQAQAAFFMKNMHRETNLITSCEMTYSDSTGCLILFYGDINEVTNSIKVCYQLDNAVFGIDSKEVEQLIGFIRRLGFSERLISDKQIKNPISLIKGLKFSKKL